MHEREQNMKVGKQQPRHSTDILKITLLFIGLGTTIYVAHEIVRGIAKEISTEIT